MKTVSQRSKLRTVAKPDELQSLHPLWAGECGKRITGKAEYPSKVRLRSLQKTIRKYYRA